MDGGVALEPEEAETSRSEWISPYTRIEILAHVPPKYRQEFSSQKAFSTSDTVLYAVVYKHRGRNIWLSMYSANWNNFIQLQGR